MWKLAAITKQIENEIKVDENGVGRASIRATARLADIYESSLRRGLSIATIIDNSAAQGGCNLATHLTDKGFDCAAQEDWKVDGIPDIAIAAILEYYAFYAGRYCTEQSRLVLAAFSGIGIRVWLQQLSGYEKPTPQETIDFKSELNFLVESDNTLAKIKNPVIKRLAESRIQIEAKRYGISIEFPKQQVIQPQVYVGNSTKTYTILELVEATLKGIESICKKTSFKREFTISDVTRYSRKLGLSNKSIQSEHIFDVLVNNSFVDISRTNKMGKFVYKLRQTTHSEFNQASKLLVNKLKREEENA